MSDFPEYAQVNRQHWNRHADWWVNPGRRSWDSDQRRWGIWGIANDELAALYERLREHPFFLQCPFIRDVRVHDGVPYTVETRLPGNPMSEVCRSLDDDDRRRILRNYMDTLCELRAVEVDDVEFGGLISSTAWLTARTWEVFLRRQLAAPLDRVGTRLSAEITDLERTVTRLESLLNGPMGWDRKSLVHGDAFPHNVLVGDQGEVTAILDFGKDTLIGDPRLDIAIAVELTELAGFTAEDTAYLHELPPGDPVEVNAIRVYTAILLATRHHHYTRLVEKCMDSLHATIGTF